MTTIAKPQTNEQHPSFGAGKKLGRMMKWYGQNAGLSLIIFYCVILALYLLFSIIISVAAEDGSVGGIKNSSYIMLFILSILFFPQGTRFALASGVSRRITFLSFLCFSLIACVVITLLDQLLASGFLALTGRQSEELLQVLYTPQPGFSALVAQLICNISILLAASAVGYFIGGAYYRMSRIVKILVSAGVPALVIVGLPLLFMVLPPAAQAAVINAVQALGNFLMVSPYRLALCMAVITVVFFLLAWLLIRRAPAKNSF